jgi:hypothetical protein
MQSSECGAPEGKVGRTGDSPSASAIKDQHICTRQNFPSATASSDELNVIEPDCATRSLDNPLYLWPSDFPSSELADEV